MDEYSAKLISESEASLKKCDINTARILPDRMLLEKIFVTLSELNRKIDRINP